MVEELEQDHAPVGSRSADFIERVKQLLEHLYDSPFLQAHVLASHPVVRHSDVNATPSQALRQVLMRAIDVPKTSSDRMSATHVRYLKLVYTHYVDGMTIQEAAYSLGVSERQAYRDLQRGIESVASALWEILNAPQNAIVETELPQPMSVEAEVDRLMPHVATVDLAVLVQYAKHAVQKIAQQRQIQLEVELPPTTCSVRTNEMVAQQLVVRVLSQIVQSLDTATVWIRIVNNPRSAELSLRIDGAEFNQSVLRSDTLALQLFERLGWSYAWNDAVFDSPTLIITAPTDLRFLLVIDDNESQAELLDRYLMNMPYRIVGVTNPREGLRLAQELLPDVIMLDIMMPEMDGWQLLQRFHNSAKTTDIPIIVCSVFNDPELAHSLGATLFLPKPLSRELFLDALHRLELSDDHDAPETSRT